MKNIYTDSVEKNVIRYTDLKLLNHFIKLGEFKNYNYLGLPSIEFLDLICWENVINSALACENIEETFKAMQIAKHKHNFKFPIKIEYIDIDTKINNLSKSFSEINFNLYNIDLCGGMIYGENYSKNKLDSIRNIFNIHTNKKNNFIIISTINVRDKGADFLKSKIINFYETYFSNLENHKYNLKEHLKNQYSRYKIFFLFQCHIFAKTNNYDQTVYPILVYRSNKTNLIHFVQKFIYNDDIQDSVSSSFLKSIANQSIFRIEGSSPFKKAIYRYTKIS